jgi:type I restriction enzyme S subunit
MGPADWASTSLGELLRVKHGFAFRGEHFATSPGPIILAPGNFNAGGGLQLRPGKDRSYAATFPSEFLLREGELLVVMTDLTQEAAILGAPAFVPASGEFLHNQRLGKITDVAVGRLDQRFLYYILNSHGYREHLKATATGSTVRHTSPSRIYTCPVWLPSMGEQQRIAEILGAYDDLIDVNRRRVELLEDMARRLFDEWFVRFRFPGHQAVPGADGSEQTLPTGWTRKELGSFLSLAYGKALRADDREPGTFSVIGSSGVVGSHSAPLVHQSGIVLGRKGNVGAVIWSPVGFWPIDTVYYVKSERPQLYLLELLKRVSFQNTDAAVPGLNRDAALKKVVIDPPQELVERYHMFCTPVRAFADQLQASIKGLCGSRDLLLPRLISGRLSVADAERELAQAA